MADDPVTTASTQTLENKTLVSPVVDEEVHKPDADTVSHFTFRGRQGVGWPVPYLRPTETNSFIALDVSPNGTPKPHANAGFSWTDWTNGDVDDPNAVFAAARVGIKPEGVHLGSWKQAEHSSVPVLLQVDGLEVSRLTARGFSTSSKFLNFGPSIRNRIDSGSITAPGTFFLVDTESFRDADDLDMINGGSEGDLIIFRSVSSERVVTIRHGTGNILNGAGESVTLDSVNKVAFYIFSENFWRGGILM